MKQAKQLGIWDLIIHCDSLLVANQLTGEYAANNERIAAYMKLAQRLVIKFNSVYIERFPRANKSYDNALPTLTSAMDSKLKRDVEVEFLPSPSIKPGEQQIMYDIEVNLGIS